MSFIERPGLSIPLVQAPIAGVSTPELAAIASNEGVFGSIVAGADAFGARAMPAARLIARLKAGLRNCRLPPPLQTINAPGRVPAPDPDRGDG